MIFISLCDHLHTFCIIIKFELEKDKELVEVMQQTRSDKRRSKLDTIKNLDTQT
jgi:hypothetical protein